MAKRVPAQNNPADLTQAATDRHWRNRFLDHLAESSNVTRSAEHAGIEVSRVYRLRRAQPDFAHQWQTALCEGYSHLEMEVLRRLREGDFKTGDGEKFDFANAIRLLAAHRDTASTGQSREPDVSAAEVRASIDRKIEEIRRRLAKSKPDSAAA
ncbi:hypothetical protein [Porphyrobacter sp. AAP60]|uniref:hypothetical protein n=1 Tax=Porphyrobacter sp. AAP60 TaxID=1523423 RepID=UPI0006B992C3|nr:hypothetical protein [Porphyrobacter sp. AAP60]KPF63013.1 hypothetical protein IP79_10620 [Porphyrobacter sp. AAP60]